MLKCSFCGKEDENPNLFLKVKHEGKEIILCLECEFHLFGESRKLTEDELKQYYHLKK